MIGSHADGAAEMPAWFESELVTRGTEIDATATVGMTVVLRYFEHLRWGLMKEEALGLNPLIDLGHFFVVRAQTVELRQRVGQDVPLAVRTRMDGVGRSTATVLHEARDPDGALVARARVLGVWLGPDRRMVRLSDHFRAAVAEQKARHSEAPAESSERREPANDRQSDEAPRVISVAGGFANSFVRPPRVTFSPLSVSVDAPAGAPERPISEHTITVPPRDLDVFSHVNAATWLTYADDARIIAAERGLIDDELARGYVVRSALFYGREASCHDTLRVVLGELDGAFAERHALGAWFYRDSDSEPLCTVRVDMAKGARAVTTPGTAST